MNPEEALSLVRPCILALDPYSTARDECGDNQPEVFLDANESPYENGINRYPDPRQKVLKEKAFPPTACSWGTAATKPSTCCTASSAIRGRTMPFPSLPVTGCTASPLR